MRSIEYQDREDAGRVLAERLLGRVELPCVVAAIPRGGVIVAGPIAERLGCPLTLAFVRKIALPQAPELAIGALDEDGHSVIDRALTRTLARSHADLEQARLRVGQEIQRQQRAFPAPSFATFLPRSTVLLVDDGLATGYTMRAALAYARRHGARRIVVAVPCASVSAAETMQREADAFVCPWVDEAFVAVGAYYDDFAAVTDDEVVAVLEQARARSAAPAAPATIGRP